MVDFLFFMGFFNTVGWISIKQLLYLHLLDINSIKVPKRKTLGMAKANNYPKFVAHTLLSLTNYPCIALWGLVTISSIHPKA